MKPARTMTKVVGSGTGVLKLQERARARTHFEKQAEQILAA